MDDEVKPPKGNDEFQFSEAEVEETSYPTDTAPRSAQAVTGSRINRRNVLIALGIIIVALSLYKLIGVFWGTDRGRPPIAPVITETQPSQIPPQGMVQVQQPTPVALPDEMQEQLSKVQQHAEESKQQINMITSDLNNLTNQVANLQNSIQTITQQLQAITTTLRQQQAVITELKPKIKKTVLPYRGPRVAIVYMRPQWYVRAIIPGRAWLIREDGHQTTVEVGDKLLGYGIIKTISVTKGLVYTSSGAIIKYREYRGL